MVQHVRTRQCTAIIADIVDSRSLSHQDRQELQRQLQSVLKDWNHRYRNSQLAKFTITTGDEFQGLLKSPAVLPEIIRTLEIALPQVRFRIGIGFGELYTDLTPTAVGMDGPVWHNAREAISHAKTHGQFGGVFVGFSDQTPALNSLSRFLHHHFSTMTPQQRQIADLLRQGSTVKAIAEQMNLLSTNVSRQKKSIAWDMLAEGEDALKYSLQLFDSTDVWTNS